MLTLTWSLSLTLTPTLNLTLTLILKLTLTPTLILTLKPTLILTLTLTPIPTLTLTPTPTLTLTLTLTPSHRPVLSAQGPGGAAPPGWEMGGGPYLPEDGVEVRAMELLRDARGGQLGPQ